MKDIRKTESGDLSSSSFNINFLLLLHLYIFS